MYTLNLTRSLFGRRQLRFRTFSIECFTNPTEPAILSKLVYVIRHQLLVFTVTNYVIEVRVFCLLGILQDQGDVRWRSDRLG